MNNNSPAKNPNLVLLGMAKHAIDMENERKKNIEARAGLALAFLATTIVFLLQETGEALEEDKKILSPVVRDSFLSSMPFNDYTRLDFMIIIDIILCILVLFFAFKSIRHFIDVFATNENYKSLKIDSIIDIAIEDDDAALFAFDASGIYMEQLENNIKLTDIKVNSFEKGLLFLKYSIVTLGIQYFFKFLTILFIS